MKIGLEVSLVVPRPSTPVAVGGETDPAMSARGLGMGALGTTALGG